MKSKLYKSGLCGEMAVALHEITGLPLGVISGAFTVTQAMVDKPGSMYFDDEVGTTQYENCHAVVLVGKDKWLDVDGEHEGVPDDCVFTTPGIEGVVIRKLGKEDVEAAFSMSGFDEQDIEEAKEFVQEQPWFKASKWASKLTASTRKQVAEALLKAADRLGNMQPKAVESAIKKAKSSVSRMGGGCFAWAIAIHRVLLPEGKLVVGLNKAIFEDDMNIVGHAAVVLGDPDSPDAEWFDSEGKTDRDRVESWGALDESEDTWDQYGRPGSLDDWKTAAYETEVIVFDNEDELLSYLPPMESDVNRVEAALRKARKP